MNNEESTASVQTSAMQMPAQSSRAVAAELRNVKKSFSGGTSSVEVLHGIDLDIRAGEFTAIMGPSGSGKSTLMQIMAGLDSPTSGSVHVSGHDLVSMNDNDLTDFRASNIGFVFQSFNLLPSLSVRDNILMPLRLSGSPISGEVKTWMEELTTRLGIGQVLNRVPAALSGGQQQRVAIVRALIAHPRIIFADEPTGSLDAASGREMLRVLRSLVDDTQETIVMVTHDPVAASYADRVLVLRDGEIVEDGVAADASTIAARMLQLEGTR